MLARLTECRWCGDTGPGHNCTENEPWGDEDDLPFSEPLDDTLEVDVEF